MQTKATYRRLLIFRYCLFLLSLSLGTIGAAEVPLILCENFKVAAAYNISGKLRAHGFTNRGIDAFTENCHPLIWKLVLNMTNQNYHPVRVLEVGCGNGRALLNLQYLLNNKVELTCANKGGYRYPQANGEIDFIRLAVQSNMSLICDSVTNLPIVPEVYLTNLGLGKEPFLPSMQNKFDFVYSQYALDIGKIASNEIGAAIERVIDTLRVGGVAVLLPCLSFKYFVSKLNITSESSSFSIVKQAHTAKFSVFLYIYWGHFVGFVIKKCTGNVLSNRLLHGCFDQKISSVFGDLNSFQIKLFVNRSDIEKFRRVYQSAVSPNSTFSRDVTPDGHPSEWEYRFEHFQEAMRWFKGLDNQTHF